HLPEEHKDPVTLSDLILGTGVTRFEVFAVFPSLMAELKEQTYFLKDLKPNMKRVSCMFIVLELGPTTRTKDGNEVRTAKVADRTGTINLSVWNENSSLIAPCDVIQLLQGNTTVRGGCLTLNVGRFGQLIKIGEYVTIGCAAVLMLLSRFCFPFAETPDLSAFNEEWLTKAQTDNLSAPKKSTEPVTTK
ncbi:SOSS complex subunit B1, partial [Fasciolopsis buskii]